MIKFVMCLRTAASGLQSGHHSRRASRTGPTARVPCVPFLHAHFDAFLEGYEERYQSRYSFLDKMQVNEPDRRGLDGSVIYRSAMNVKIQRNSSAPFGALSMSKGFEVFTPSDFIAAITQHIPEKSFQLVRYYG